MFKSLVESSDQYLYEISKLHKLCDEKFEGINAYILNMPRLPKESVDRQIQIYSDKESIVVENNEANPSLKIVEAEAAEYGLSTEDYKLLILQKAKEFKHTRQYFSMLINTFRAKGEKLVVSGDIDGFLKFGEALGVDTTVEDIVKF